MSKLGNIEIPNYPLQESVDAVKKIYDQLKRDEISSDHIASVLGFTPRTGGFNARLFDLKLYGLVEGRGSKIRVTELAVKATYGTTEECELAYDTALKNVPLWKMIFDKWGISIPAESFYIDLAIMAGIERSESKTEADKVRKLYMDDARYFITVKTPEAGPEPKKSISGVDPEQARDRKSKTMSEPTQTVSKDFVAYLGFPEYIEKPLVIKDSLSLGIAKELMKAIEERINRKQMPSDETLPEVEEN